MKEIDALLERAESLTKEELLAELQRLRSGIRARDVKGAVIGQGAHVEAGMIVGELVTGGEPGRGQESLSEERNFLRWIIRTCARLNLGAVTESAMVEEGFNLELSQVFVQPNIITEFTEEDMGVEGEGEVRPLSVIESASRHERLVLLGDPGGGKSSSLNFLSLALASERYRRLPDTSPLGRLKPPRLDGWEHGSLLPIPIKLRDLARWQERHGSSAGNLILSYIKDLCSKQLALKQLFPRIDELMKKGEAIVMLDGLDEMSSTKVRKKVNREILRFSDRRPETRIVATCRVLSYADKHLQLPSFVDQTLAPLTPDQSGKFVELWYQRRQQAGAHGAETAAARVKSLKAILPRMSHLAANPLLLTVMAIVHSSRGSLPKEKARLYKQCCDLLLLEWQKNRYFADVETGISGVLETDDLTLTKALQHLAFEMHCQQGEGAAGGDFRESEVLSIFHRYLGGSWDKAREFLDYIHDRSGILLGRGKSAEHNERIFAFPHRSFQEFLAACHLATTQGYSRRVLGYFQAENNEHWREVAMLSVGHLAFNMSSNYPIFDLANMLMSVEHTDELEASRACWWAAEALALVGVNAAERDELGRSVVDKIRNRLVEIIDEGRLAPRELHSAGEALSGINDPRPGVCNLPPRCLEVPGGTVLIGALGSDKDANPNEQPHASITLGSFDLSVFPVTNAQFELFVRDSGYLREELWTPEGWSAKKFKGWKAPEYFDDPYLGSANKPVVGVSWFEADAFCSWLTSQSDDNYRLPAECQWEMAARQAGGTSYPWGDRWREGVANSAELGLRGPTAVGSFHQGASWCGLLDMAGNVWEWCSSIFKPYPYKRDDGREDRESAASRVLRGGAYNSGRFLLRTSYRMWRLPSYRCQYIGFRIAKDQQAA